MRSQADMNFRGTLFSPLSLMKRQECQWEPERSTRKPTPCQGISHGCSWAEGHTALHQALWGVGFSQGKAGDTTHRAHFLKLT